MADQLRRPDDNDTSNDRPSNDKPEHGEMLPCCAHCGRRLSRYRRPQLIQIPVVLPTVGRAESGIGKDYTLALCPDCSNLLHGDDVESSDEMWEGLITSLERQLVAGQE